MEAWHGRVVALPVHHEVTVQNVCDCETTKEQSEGRSGGLYSVISSSLWPPLSPRRTREHTHPSGERERVEGKGTEVREDGRGGGVRGGRETRREGADEIEKRKSKSVDKRNRALHFALLCKRVYFPPLPASLSPSSLSPSSLSPSSLSPCPPPASLPRGEPELWIYAPCDWTRCPDPVGQMSSGEEVEVEVEVEVARGSGRRGGSACVGQVGDKWGREELAVGRRERRRRLGLHLPPPPSSLLLPPPPAS
ncbi:unnamed protein product [Pleuronectes platessa]|uniref:Uncharacterized protein n=1 Tax=Pleuronectes platessa TaxID=8262 RepID=A0A9N7YST3_PLEPL|nr:unnamed protein product [Pleuronectes platessa]